MFDTVTDQTGASKNDLLGSVAEKYGSQTGSCSYQVVAINLLVLIWLDINSGSVPLRTQDPALSQLPDLDDEGHSQTSSYLHSESFQHSAIPKTGMRRKPTNSRANRIYFSFSTGLLTWSGNTTQAPNYATHWLGKTQFWPQAREPYPATVPSPGSLRSFCPLT